MAVQASYLSFLPPAFSIGWERERECAGVNVPFSHNVGLGIRIWWWREKEESPRAQEKKTVSFPPPLAQGLDRPKSDWLFCFTVPFSLAEKQMGFRAKDSAIRE